jgi:hypothetical protein
MPPQRQPVAARRFTQGKSSQTFKSAVDNTCPAISLSYCRLQSSSSSRRATTSTLQSGHRSISNTTTLTHWQALEKRSP